MAYTLAQTITEVRSIINEATEGFWSDTELTRFIQEGTLDLSTKLLGVVATADLTLTSGQYSYTSVDASWIGNCLKTKSVWYKSSSTTIRGMQQIQPHLFGHLDVKDTLPKYYCFDSFSKTLYIAPTPAVSTSTLKITYCYRSNDVTALIDEHQPLVFLYAAARAKIKERLYQDANILWQQYISSVNYERQDKFDLGSQFTSDFILPDKIPQRQ